MEEKKKRNQMIAGNVRDQTLSLRPLVHDAGGKLSASLNVILLGGRVDAQLILLRPASYFLC